MRVGEAANKQDITFVYCKRSEDFAGLLALATQYQPCVLMLEDVESAGGGEERNDELNNLLNTLDGVQTKGKAITCIFTTNHPDRINKAMRRPGRLDVILGFGFCEPSTVNKIYLDRFQALPGGSVLDYAKLVTATPTAQGAVIAEICSRAIDTAEAINDGNLTDDIVLTAVDSIKVQLEFMHKDPEDGSNKLESALKLVAQKAFGNTLADAFETQYNEGLLDAAKVLRS